MSRRLASLALPLLLALPPLACGGDQVSLGTNPPDAAPPADVDQPDAPIPPLVFGDSWSQTPGPNGGNVNAFASGGTRLYAGVYRTLFGSDDDGLTWQVLSVFSEDAPNWYIWLVAAQGDDVAVLTANSPSHLLISHDRGATFADIDAGSLFATEMDFAGDRLLVSDGSNLYALDPGAGALAPLTLDLPPDLFLGTGDQAVAAVGDTVVIITMGLGQTGLAVSSDRGDHFAAAGGAPSNPAPFDQPFLSAVNAVDGTFYLSGVNLAGDQGWRSTDGDTWEGMGSDFPASVGNQVAMTEDAFYSFDQYHIWRSPLAPVSWTLDSVSFGPELETPIFAHLVSHEGRVLVASMDQEIYRREASGEWVISNDGMLAPSVPMLATSGEVIVAGIGFGKLWRSADDGATWQRGTGLPHGFGGGAILGEPGLLLTGDGRNGIYRSEDGGVTWADSSSGFGEYNGMAGWQRREVAAITRAPGHTIFAATGAGLEGAFEGEIFATSGGVYRSDDDGDHWFAYNDGFPIMGPGLEGPRYEPSVAAHAFHDSLLVATSIGLLRNDGAGWRPSNTGLSPATAIVGFVDDGATIWTASAGYSGSGSAGVYRSDDAGETWTRTDGVFFGGKRIFSLTSRLGALFVATSNQNGEEGRVYVSSDGGSTWTLVGNWDSGGGGTPLSLLATDHALFAGTQQQGLWRLMVDFPE